MGNSLRAGGGTITSRAYERTPSATPKRNGRNPIVVAFQAILEHISDGVLITDASGRRLYTNPALDKLVGHDGRETTTLTGPPSWLPEDQHLRYSSYLAEFAAGKLNGQLVTLEWSIVDGDGTRRPVAMKLVPMQDADGRLSALFWLVVPTAPSADEERLNELESCIRKIANELDQLGVRATATPPDYSQIPGLKKLSRREWEVLDRLLEGHRVSSIADILCVSEHTVRNHLKSIFKKVDVHSQVELVEKLRAV